MLSKEKRADTHVHHSSWFENWKKWEDIMPLKNSTQGFSTFELTVSKKCFLVRFISGLQDGDVVLTYSHQIKIKQRRNW